MNVIELGVLLTLISFIGYVIFRPKHSSKTMTYIVNEFKACVEDGSNERLIGLIEMITKERLRNRCYTAEQKIKMYNSLYQIEVENSRHVTVRFLIKDLL